MNQSFFLVCIGVLNYLYSSDAEFIAILAILLEKQRVHLHDMTESEMLEVLQAPDTRSYQKLYGSTLLCQRFYEFHLHHRIM